MPTDERDDDLEQPTEHEPEDSSDQETDREVADRLARHSRPTTAPIDPAATRPDAAPNNTGT
jgi:hypothetical protein